MNKQLQEFARSTLKKQLSMLPEKNQRIFKLMYGRNLNARGDAKRSVADTELMSINNVVDEMPEDNLSWAMEQVERTINDA